MFKKHITTKLHYDFKNQGGNQPFFFFAQKYFDHRSRNLLSLKRPTSLALAEAWEGDYITKNSNITIQLMKF